MRIVKDLEKRKNPSESRDPKFKQYLFGMEGCVTEWRYFNGLRNNRRTLGIKDIIKIKLIKREKNAEVDETGWSNLRKFLSEFNKQKKELIEQSEFVEGLDKLCFVFDRDKKSYNETDYKELSQECVKQKIALYITNPAFEFWLMLHFSDCKHFSNDDIINLKYIDELSDKIDYNGKRFSFDKLKYNIKDAIKNAESFCQELSGLEESVGTNLGLLMKEILS